MTSLSRCSMFHPVTSSEYQLWTGWPLMVVVSKRTRKPMVTSDNSASTVSSSSTALEMSQWVVYGHDIWSSTQSDYKVSAVLVNLSKPVLSIDLTTGQKYVFVFANRQQHQRSIGTMAGLSCHSFDLWSVEFTTSRDRYEI